MKYMKNIRVLNLMDNVENDEIILLLIKNSKYLENLEVINYTGIKILLKVENEMSVELSDIIEKRIKYLRKLKRIKLSGNINFKMKITNHLVVKGSI